VVGGGGTSTASQNQLWGGNGSDTVDYSAQTASVYVDLGSGGGYGGIYCFALTP